MPFQKALAGPQNQAGKTDTADPPRRRKLRRRDLGSYASAGQAFDEEVSSAVSQILPEPVAAANSSAALRLLLSTESVGVLQDRRHRLSLAR